MEEKHKVNKFHLYQTCIQRDLFTLPFDKKKKKKRGTDMNTLPHKQTNLVINVVIFILKDATICL